VDQAAVVVTAPDRHQVVQEHQAKEITEAAVFKVGNTLAVAAEVLVKQVKLELHHMVVTAVMAHKTQ
jgi:hypothetical protein